VAGPIQLSYGEFRSILRQAQREEEALAAGFVTHAEMVKAHRSARVAKLQAARVARLVAMRGQRCPLDTALAKIYNSV